MVLELTPKKRKWILIVLILLLGLFTVWCIYSIRSRNYPFLVASIWQCKEPHFSIVYGSAENGMLTSSEELEWNNKTMPVEVCFLMSEYDVYPVGSCTYKERLFSGTWKYRNGDLILIIEEDFIFDNQYTELVFSPVA